MFKVKIITVGSVKEGYLRDACAEYEKRLSAFCRPEIIELKEARLPDAPSGARIKAALADEGERILAAVPPRASTVALCVEGTERTSEDFAKLIEDAKSSSDCLCFIIGSSYGLAPEVKSFCKTRLSFSKMTFPHQLMRVILLEQIYRGFTITAGKTYHK